MDEQIHIVKNEDRKVYWGIFDADHTWAFAFEVK